MHRAGQTGIVGSNQHGDTFLDFYGLSRVVVKGVVEITSFINLFARAVNLSPLMAALANGPTIGARETIRIDEKDYDTFAVTPDMEGLEKIVEKSDDPQLKIWFTADDKKFP